MSSSDGKTFGNYVTPFSNAPALSGPALAEFNGQLYMVWSGAGDNIMVSSTNDGQT